MILQDFQSFEGEHCETVAIGNLLKHEGLDMSEPMLFGIAAGLGFIYWKMKTMPLPFLGGRTKILKQNTLRLTSLRKMGMQSFFINSRLENSMFYTSFTRQVLT